MEVEQAELYFENLYAVRGGWLFDISYGMSCGLSYSLLHLSLK